MKTYKELKAFMSERLYAEELNALLDLMANHLERMATRGCKYAKVGVDCHDCSKIALPEETIKQRLVDLFNEHGYVVTEAKRRIGTHIVNDPDGLLFTIDLTQEYK